MSPVSNTGLTKAKPNLQNEKKKKKKKRKEKRKTKESEKEQRYRMFELMIR